MVPLWSFYGFPAALILPEAFPELLKSPSYRGFNRGSVPSKRESFSAFVLLLPLKSITKPTKATHTNKTITFSFTFVFNGYLIMYSLATIDLLEVGGREVFCHSAKLPPNFVSSIRFGYFTRHGCPVWFNAEIFGDNGNVFNRTVGSVPAIVPISSVIVCRPFSSGEKSWSKNFLVQPVRLLQGCRNKSQFAPQQALRFNTVARTTLHEQPEIRDHSRRSGSQN